MKASHCLHVPSCWPGHHAQLPSPLSYNGVSSSCVVHLKLLCRSDENRSVRSVRVEIRKVVVSKGKWSWQAFRKWRLMKWEEKHTIAFPRSIWTRNYTVGDTSNEAEHDCGSWGRNATVTVIRTALLKFVAICPFIHIYGTQHVTVTDIINPESWFSYFRNTILSI